VCRPPPLGEWAKHDSYLCADPKSCVDFHIYFFPIFLSLIFLSKELIRIHRERVQRAQEKDFVLLRSLRSFAVNFFEDGGD